MKTSYLAVLLILVTGCTGFSTPEERHARNQLEATSASYKPLDSGQLPVIRETAPLQELMSIAVERSPQVRAAYFDWASAVEKITVERSLPDPRLTFESDIEDVVMSLMPGLMIDIPGPGKLRAMAAVAAAEAAAKFAEFRKAVLMSAADLKKSYYELQALEESIEINERNLGFVHNLREIAGSQHSAGKATLQDVLRADIEADEVSVRIENLKDSQSVVRARYRAALGIPPDNDHIVPIPKDFVNTFEIPALDELYAIAVRENPTLAQMEAEIRRADAAVTVARRSAVPDFGFGLEADVKPNKPIITPQLSITLPIWRDKIAAEIESASAAKGAAVARLSQEKLLLAVEFASMAFMYRESDREYRLFDERLIPKARSSLDVARSGYVGGQSSFVDFIEAQRALLQYELSRVEARKNREVALANLSLTIAGIAPLPGLGRRVDLEDRAGAGDGL